MLHIAPRLMVLFLCGSVLAGCSTVASVVALSGADSAASRAKKVTAAAAITEKTPPTDLEGGVRQAQMMRLAGHYDQAIATLSQLMLIASDNPRVVSEYGKTLAEKGRAQDAVEFLSRAVELSPNDWTIYSALGVSYDQLGNQVAARAAYDHALALRPGESSVLNNYALSRMLANDADGARILILQAQAAGGSSDSKIAANIAMLNKLAPVPEVPQVSVAQTPAPASVQTASIAPQTRPAPIPARQAVQARPAPVARAAQAMPRQMLASLPQQQQPVIQDGKQIPMPQQRQVATQNSAVVMQAVPFDPLAGPVPVKRNDAPIVLRQPPAKAATAAKTNAAPSRVASDIQPPKFEIIQPAKPAGNVKPAPVKTAAKNQIPALRMSANAY